MAYSFRGFSRRSGYDRTRILQWIERPAPTSECHIRRGHEILNEAFGPLFHGTTIDIRAGQVSGKGEIKMATESFYETNRVGSDGLSHRLPSHTTVRAGRHTAVGPPFLNRFPIVHEEEHALFLQP